MLCPFAVILAFQVPWGHPSSFADIAPWILNFAPALIIKW